MKSVQSRRVSKGVRLWKSPTEGSALEWRVHLRPGGCELAVRIKKLSEVETQQREKKAGSVLTASMNIV